MMCDDLMEDVVGVGCNWWLLTERRSWLVEGGSLLLGGLSLVDGGVEGSSLVAGGIYIVHWKVPVHCQ